MMHVRLSVSPKTLDSHDVDSHSRKVHMLSYANFKLIENFSNRYFSNNFDICILSYIYAFIGPSSR